MALNDWAAPSSIRKPRSIITANGQPISKWNSWEVVNNPGHFVSDNFTIKMPLYGQPADMNAAWWLDQSTVEIEVKVGIADNRGALNNPASLIIGLVDTVSLDVDGGLLTISGRDYSGALIETRINETAYANLTSSAIATEIIKNHVGLTGQITATTTQIGIYYNDPKTRLYLANNATEWDFLTELADREGFRVFMTGRTLVFGPLAAQDTRNPYIINATSITKGPPTLANFTRLAISRALTVARDIIVTVHSADPLTGRDVTGTFQAVNVVRANRSGAKAPAQRYDINIPRLTQQQAQQKAQALAMSITKQERVLDIDLPGDPILATFPIVQLIGSGTSADQVYFLDRVEHRMAGGDEAGYWCKVRAKNNSAGTQFSVTQ